MSDLIERLRKHSERSVGHWEDYANATDSICTEAADALSAKDVQIESIEGELEEARDVPWPDWANTILKTMQKYGYDPVVDGEVDLGEAFKDYLEGVDQEDMAQRAALAAKDAEIEALEKGLAEWQADCANLAGEASRMREALEPFAKAADVKLCGEWRDDERFAQTDVGHYLTFGDLRAARAALNPEASTNG